MKLFFNLIFVLGIIAFLGSCKGHTHENGEDTEASAEKTGKEYASAFICPMHCEGSGSDEAGKCPVCGMDYVANEEHNSDGHSHADDGDEGNQEEEGGDSDGDNNTEKDEDGDGHNHDGDDHDLN